MMSVKGKVKGLERLHYAYVTKITVEVGKKEEVVFEIPDKILDEINWSPSLNDRVEIEVSKEAGDTDAWNIVMMGEVYLKKEEEKKVIASMGGLQLSIISEKYYPEFKVGDKVYFKLKRI
ncbi:MAG: hypothetical protein DRJ35_03160 [Thermoprotei archaeon]|nr:MAG: hypothetical protein DRJ35_03160 [Thermoprotei archaeon]